MRRPVSDRDGVMQHALDRMFERFGLDLTVDEYDRLTADVERRLRRPDGKSPAGKLVYEVKIGTIVAYAAWNDSTQQIGTFHRGERCRLYRTATVQR